MEDSGIRQPADNSEAVGGNVCNNTGCKVDGDVNKNASTGLIFASLLVFACGVAYYLTFRHAIASPNLWAQSAIQWLPEHHTHWLADLGAANNLTDWSGGTFPSFVHMLSLGLLSFGLLGYINGARLILILLGTTVIAEFGIGTTDPHDIFAALLGTTATLVIGNRVFSTNSSRVLNQTTNSVFSSANYHQQHQQSSRRFYHTLSSISILFCASFFITGTSCVTPSCEAGTNAKPVYMDYNTLRSAVAVGDPIEVDEVKRVYLYKQYIFLNRKNEGIHIIDNSDPANPNNLRFISIPGNTELAIRDDYLYADSYVDLITLDLNNPTDIQEVARQQDIFPWDANQNVPDNIYFDYFDIDRSRGVVVDYEIQ